MKAGLLVGGALLTALAIAVAVPGAHAQNKRRDRGNWDDGRKHYSFNTRTPDGGPVTSCSQVEVTVRDGEMARDEEVQTIPASAQGVNVTGGRNGPVYVSGSDRTDYQVSLCKFTAGETADEARARLADLSLNVQNDRVTVNSPNDSDNATMTYVIVEAPRDAKLNVQATNGPLSIRTISGHLVARALNGPLSVSEVSGDIDIQATNGPLSLNQAAGRVRVNAQNGPMSLNLSGTEWQGAGLEASAQNGPMSLNLPEGYRSGVLVDISSNSPFHCSYSACRGAQRNWDDRGRTLRFGEQQGNPIVRVTASNGPVSIGSERD
jgi:DUF4097 and DUF4098 domain-containing protein YvlB